MFDTDGFEPERIRGVNERIFIYQAHMVYQETTVWISRPC